MKGIASDDDRVVKESFEKADRFMTEKEEPGVVEVEGVKTRTGVNRTVINKSSADSEPNFAGNTNQDAFLSMLEKDANERHQRKRENTRLATALKEKGNAEFQRGNYQQAVDFYTEVNFWFFFEESLQNSL